MQCLATFETTHMALKFEKSCRKKGLDARIIPVPRELSSSCGFACRFDCEKRHEVDELIEAFNIDVAEFHELEDI